MNKIHNNLTIENLIKTDWFNQFDRKQQEQIISGLDSNIDVLIYAKPEFDWEQMKEIRLGLEKNLNVSFYAITDFNNYRMYELRKLLERNAIDFSEFGNLTEEEAYQRKLELTIKEIEDSIDHFYEG